MKRFRNEKGFTLIELMIVIVIIGILAAIAIPRFATVRDDAEQASCRQNLNSLATAEEMYYADNASYTDNSGDELDTYIQNSSSMSCPSDDSSYGIALISNGYSIACANSTSHGNIVNGVASW
jgi:type II secretion system protein G